MVITTVIRNTVFQVGMKNPDSYSQFPVCVEVGQPGAWE